MDIQLIADHGAYFYLLVFVWTFFEGETIVLFAAFAAAQGLLDPWLLLVCVRASAAILAISAISGSAGNTACGCSKRFPSWRPGVENALSWLERYDVWFILSFRFIYGVRNFSSFALGLSAVRWDRFLRLNFLAAMVWAASFVAIGYFLGHAFSTAVNIANWLGYALLGVFVALGRGIWLLHRRHRRRMRAARNAKPVGARQMLPPN